MVSKIKLVQGDTNPQLMFALTDSFTGEPCDLSAAGARVVMKLREAGSDATKEVIECHKMPGKLDLDTGEVDSNVPYATPGSGGRVFMAWTDTALDTAGAFEAEIEITFADGSVQTVYDPLRFIVRPEFA